MRKKENVYIREKEGGKERLRQTDRQTHTHKHSESEKEGGGSETERWKKRKYLK